MIEYREPEEVFDWAAYEPQFSSAQVVHLPQPIPGTPLPEVRYGTDGVPHYAYIPAQYPGRNPQAELLEARGRFLACVGVCALGVGGGCWLLFDGLARVAVTSIVGLGVIAAAVVYLKIDSGIRIGHLHQGDSSNLQIGGRR